MTDDNNRENLYYARTNRPGDNVYVPCGHSKVLDMKVKAMVEDGYAPCKFHYTHRWGLVTTGHFYIKIKKDGTYEAWKLQKGGA